MRYLPLFFLTAAAWGQAADSDSHLLQALLTEVQQLRVAIERSTLLGTRTQLVISKLQMQETRVSHYRASWPICARRVRISLWRRPAFPKT